MAIATYTDLITELGDYLNRTDLSAKLPTFIRLFEARMNRVLRSPDMEQTYSFTTTPSKASYALGSGARELRSLYITSSDSIELDYTLTGESIVFDPAPTAAYTVTYTAYRTITGLDSGNATNWLLDDHPDLYLFGALAEAYAYLKDDQHAAQYLELSNEIVAEVVREANDKRMPAGPLKMQPPVSE